MKNFENREVRVFISSTFRGMNNYRKVLVDKVFPEISRRCAERGIGFTEVDLRWGITSATKGEKQEALKRRLHQKGCQISEYEQPEALENLVLEPLWEKISQKFPHALTKEQQLNFEHDAYAASRQRVYIQRQADFDRLNQHASSDAAPLIIHGESGSGKTALLSNWGAEYQENHPDTLVIWHFCGSSPNSTNPIELFRRIFLNLNSYFKWKEELANTPEAIKEQFGQSLAKATKPVILIIDGLNQLEETALTRGWLHSIPAKTSLFVSTISVENLPAEWQKWQLPLLTEKTASKELIIEYLQQYGKSLATNSMQALLQQPQTANPFEDKVFWKKTLSSNVFTSYFRRTANFWRIREIGNSP